MRTGLVPRLSRACQGSARQNGPGRMRRLSSRGAMYDDASLSSHRSIGSQVIESSVDARWRSVLLERSRSAPERRWMETRPTPDTRVVVALHGRHSVEVLKNGRWRGAEVRPGDIGMTAGNEVDSLRYWAQAPFELAYLYLPVQMVAEGAEHLRRAGQHAKPTALSRLAFADPAVTTVVSSLLIGMRTGAPDLYAEQTAHWVAIHLLVAHARADPYANVHRGERLTDERLTRVIELIRARFGDPMSLEMLASEAYVSKFHFSRLFRARTGLSPHAFLVAERMKSARRLLATTDLAVSEIARRTGYRPAQFGVAFKKAHGVTASAFRRQRLHRER